LFELGFGFSFLLCERGNLQFYTPDLLGNVVRFLLGILKPRFEGLLKLSQNSYSFYHVFFINFFGFLMLLLELLDSLLPVKFSLIKLHLPLHIFFLLY
jgi:hypothetical protein